MLKFQNATTKENFLSRVSWADEWIASAPTPCSGTRAWKIGDRFGNAWDVTFTGNVGEFTVEGTTPEGSPFKVYLYMSGDKIEIIKALDNGRNIQSDRLLGKYKYLALMVSNYLRFNLLRTT